MVSPRLLDRGLFLCARKATVLRSKGKRSNTMQHARGPETGVPAGHAQSPPYTLHHCRGPRSLSSIRLKLSRSRGNGALPERLQNARSNRAERRAGPHTPHPRTPKAKHRQPLRTKTSATMRRQLPKILISPLEPRLLFRRPGRSLPSRASRSTRRRAKVPPPS